MPNRYGNETNNQSIIEQHRWEAKAKHEHVASLKDAKPNLPEKPITDKNNFVKIATSNLFIANQPTVTVDEITNALFDSIGAKEISGLTVNTQLYVEPDVIGTSNNVSLFAEMSTYTAKTILPLGISTSNPSQSLNSSVISTQAIAATTTITPIFGLVQAQIHTIGSINKTSY